MKTEAKPPKVKTPKLLICFVLGLLFIVAWPSCGCARPKHPDRLPELLNGNGN